MNRRTGITLAVVLTALTALVTASGLAGTAHAGAGDPSIPDEVLIQPGDLDGAAVTEGGPDPTTASGVGRALVRRAGGLPGGYVTSTPGPTPTEPEWTTYQAEVTGVRPDTDPHRALIDVTVPAGDPLCARNPTTSYYTEENNLIYANVVVESARASVVGGCPTRAAAVVTLTSPEPLGDRILVLNRQAWAPAGDTYRRCDPDLGCTPPANRCERTWIDAARNILDVPRNSTFHIEHCDQNWLVLTVDVNSTACGAAPRPGCTAPPKIYRYFLRFDERWTLLNQTTTGGCAAVQAVEPAFPTAICEPLPPTR